MTQIIIDHTNHFNYLNFTQLFYAIRDHFAESEYHDMCLARRELKSEVLSEQLNQDAIFQMQCRLQYNMVPTDQYPAVAEHLAIPIKEFVLPYIESKGIKCLPLIEVETISEFYYHVAKDED